MEPGPFCCKETARPKGWCPIGSIKLLSACSADDLLKVASWTELLFEFRVEEGPAGLFNASARRAKSACFVSPRTWETCCSLLVKRPDRACWPDEMKLAANWFIVGLRAPEQCFIICGFNRSISENACRNREQLSSNKYTERHALMNDCKYLDLYLITDDAMVMLSSF